MKHLRIYLGGVKRIFRSRRRKILASALAILILVTSLRLFLFLNPKEVKAAALSLSTTATTVQIDVPNRYRAIMTTNDTDDYVIIKDRAENDGTPDTIIELRSATIEDESTSYQLSYDDSRITTILESNSTRVRIRVEGCFDTAAGEACLKDVAGGNNDVLEVSEEYTFTTEGVFVHSQFDFKDGLELDGPTGGWDGAHVIEVSFNEAASNYHSDTIIYGDGETEGTSNTSQVFTYDTDMYVVLQGVNDYQDVIVGTMNLDGDKVLSNSTTGHMYHTQSSNDYFNIKDDTTQTLVGIGGAQHFIQFHAQNELNTEVEREALFNDLTNPDYLSHTTGDLWDDKPVGDFIFASGFEGADDNLCDGGDGWSGGSCEAGTTAIGNDTSVVFDGNYAAMFSLGGTNNSAQVEADLGRNYSIFYTRMYFRLDYEDLNAWDETAITYFQDSTGWQTNILGFRQDGSGNYELTATDTASTATNAGNDGYFLLDTWHSIETKIYRHATAGTMDVWLDGNLVLSATGLDTGDTDMDYVYPGIINANQNNIQAYIDNVIVSESYIGPAHYNEAEGTYTSDMVTSDVEVDIDAGPNVSTLVDDTTVYAGDATFTVDSTTGFPSSGFAYIEGDKFSYTGTTGTTFTGIPTGGGLSIIGHADNSVVSLSQRHAPMYKMRNYRKNDAPQNVTLEQDTLTLGTEYNSSVKPFSTSYFAQDLVWYSTLESSSAVTSPDVGSAGSECGTAPTYVTGKYGNGALFDADGECLYFSKTTNIDKAKGAMEFWYQPASDYDDSAGHWFFIGWFDANNTFEFFKTSSNELNFYVNASGTLSDVSVSSSNFAWQAGDWVHLRIEWDDSASSELQLKIFVNGTEPTHTHPNSNDYDSTNLTLATNPNISNSSSTFHADGIIDEFRVYDFNGSGDQAEQATLSVGGDVSDADEYLYDPTNDYTFDFNDDDASNRGEYIWLGSDSPFAGVNMELATDGVGSSEDFDWEYWNGIAWSALTVTEQDAGSSSFTGDGNFYFTPPSDWFPYSVNGSTDLYYIRGHLEGGSYSTDPIESRIQTDILLLHYQDKVIDENQTLKIPGVTSGANPPVVYWNLDEGYGTSANDSSGHGNTGTLTGAAWQSEDLCYTGKCLYFDGSNDEITRTDDPEFDIDEAGSFTISAWIRHPDIATNPDVIAAKYEGTGGDGGYRLQMESDGDISFGIDDENTSFPEDTVTSTSADYDDNQWHHISAVKDANDNLFLYIDGNLIDTDATISATDSLDNNDDFYLGIDGDGSSNAWDGFIDEFKFYRYARSADEVKTDLVKGAGVRGAQTSYGIRDYSFLSEGLVGYWPMDESSWTVDCSTDTVFDSSGNGNHGDACPDTTGPAGGAVGKFGNGGDFDKTNDYVFVADGFTNTIKGDDTHTISAWIYPRTVSGDTTVITMDDGASYGFYIVLRTGGYYVSYGGSWRTYTSTYSLYEWQHIAVVKSSTGDNMTLYLNGVEQTSYSGTVSNTPNTNDDLMIGKSPGGYIFDGIIDETRVYNRALTPSEIEGLYNWGPGPVGYWNFDEGSGTSAYDKSGNENTGTLESSMTNDDWIPGQFGSALDFDGSDDLVSISDNSSLDITGAFTISAWINTTASGEQCIFHKGADDVVSPNWGNLYRLCLNSENRAEVSFFNGTDWNDHYGNSTSNNDGAWHHITGIYNGSDTLTTYVDGVFDGSSSKSGAVDTSSVGAAIGDVAVGDPVQFTGLIDDVRVYSYARTPAQIIEDMNAGHPVGGSPLPSQVGYWRFDEGTDNICSGGSSDTCNSGSAGTVLDGAQSGMAVPATSASGWTNSGKFGKALIFDSSDDAISITNTSVIDLNEGLSSEFTFSAWIYPESDGEADNGRIFSKGPNNGSSSGAVQLQTKLESGGLVTIASELDMTTSDCDGTHGTVPINQWSHVALSWEDDADDDVTVWINGIQYTCPASGSLASESYDFHIGGNGTGSNNTRAFDGIVDEFKIYNVALTADQIKLDMNQGKAAVWGASSTDSSGVGTWDAANEYCPPRSSGTCTPPVGEWKFDEKTGQSASDTSGNGHTGTLGSTGGSDTKDPTWTHAGECKNGACLSFDGNDYLSTATTSSLDFVDNMTLEAWIYPTGAGSTDGIIIARQSGDATTGYEFSYSDGNESIYLWKSGGAVESDFNAVTLNAWNHVVASVSSNQAIFYVNGVNVGGGAFSLEANGSNEVYMGSYSGGSEFFYGNIDHVRMYDYARTQAQVAWDYNRGGPVGYWALDECQGTTAYDSGSGGNNGTITIGSSGTNTSAGTCSSGTGTEAWNNGTTGKRNASLDFDGTDDYVQVDDTDVLDVDLTNFSASFWMYNNTQTNWAFPLSKMNDTSTDGSYGFQFDNTAPNRKLSLKLRSDSDSDTATSLSGLNTGQWYHVAGTWDGSNIRLYIDGALQNTSPVNGSNVKDTTFNLTIGIAANLVSPYFDGQIDEVKIFNYALTKQQIRNEFNQGAIRYGPDTGSP